MATVQISWLEAESASTEVTVTLSVTDGADTVSASASALITASLTLTDAADTLSSAATVSQATGFVQVSWLEAEPASTEVTADLTDEADTLDATAKAEKLEERPSGSGARNWAKFDTPFRRVYVQSAITDDDDRATAWAEVSQPIIVLEPEQEPVHQAVATVTDDDDAVFCMALVRWPSPQLVRSAALMTTARAAA